MRTSYAPDEFEAAWRERWAAADLFETTEDPAQPYFYGLEFFPYPSGHGLSVGHLRNYVPSDALCRMKRMQGHNVLHPMGFDAFGLPAENEAIRTGRSPAEMIAEYAAQYRRQLDLVGISYDWSREFKSSDPDYYKWTQWIFKLLYADGLAYRKKAAVNWCPKDKTVLADEEVEGGLCWRCGTPVVQKTIPQWFFKITEYADRLIDDLDELDWPEGIKQMQRNWIGRSEGVRFSMKVVDEGGSALGDLEVFTTRVDTIFGMTFCVVSPEHPIVGGAASPEIEGYRQRSRKLSDEDRLATGREKTGVPLGAYAINPANGERAPIWVADYVLMGYGTGAIMAVPAHDERDFEFAQKFGLPIRPVIAASEGDPELPFSTKDGALINSGEFDGEPVPIAQDSIADWLTANLIGKREVTYKLRDWLIGRQRYWGCPIPIVYDKQGFAEAVPDDQLPVELPEAESYEPSDDGSSPLSRIADWVNTTDSDGSLARRETDTMGGFACSSWYFLRFCDPHNGARAWSKESVEQWMPVDAYVGGAEHAVMHLLYARFWTKFLYDKGLVPVKEPFARLLNQGMLLAETPYRPPTQEETLHVGEVGILITPEEAASMPEDQVIWRWEKMSKSKGNVVTPDEAVERYGADALRVFQLFVAPFEQTVQWSETGMTGAVRFLGRVFKLAAALVPHYRIDWSEEITPDSARPIRRLTHQTIRRATDDIERFAFNTYVAALMEYVNGLNASLTEITEPDWGQRLALSEALETLVLLLSPAAPHSADEIWDGMGRGGFSYQAPWPVLDEELAKADSVTVAIQVNGKLRDTLEVPADTSNADLEAAALGSEKVRAHIDGMQVQKTIVVPGKLVNLVAK